MLRVREAGTSSFVCTQIAHAGTVCKLVHTKTILVRSLVMAGTVCKSSAHEAATQMESLACNKNKGVADK